MTRPIFSAVDQIDMAYHAGGPRTWSSRYPAERATTGPDVRYARYECAKQTWQAANPEATPAEYAAAMTRLARECGV